MKFLVTVLLIYSPYIERHTELNIFQSADDINFAGSKPFNKKFRMKLEFLL